MIEKKSRVNGRGYERERGNDRKKEQSIGERI